MQLAKKVMEQAYKCKFCDKKFHRESTLSTHLCVKKQRYLDIETQGSRFGFRAYQQFYKLTTNSKNPKSVDEFISSPYYIDFVKFGNFLAAIRPVYVDEYISYVIKGNVKLKDWTKEDIYYLYAENLIKTEPSFSAVERTIIEIDKWCSENKAEFSDFFRTIHENNIAHMIRAGRISPWVLYLSKSGNDIMSRFNEDHAKIVGDVIDPGFWMRKFKRMSDDTKEIKGILVRAGL